MLQDYISAYVKKHGFPGEAEYRAQQNTQRQVSIFQGQLVANSHARAEGFSARVRKNGSYGFASASATDAATIAEVIASAGTNASFLDSKLQRACKAFPANPAIERHDGLDYGVPILQKDLLDYARFVEAYLKSKYADLISSSVAVRLLDMEKLLLTSDGVYSHSLTPRSHLAVALTLPTADGMPVEAYESFGGYGDFYSTLGNPDRFLAQIDALYEGLRRKAEGVFPEAGLKEVILAPIVTGILAHEAVGHTVEADLVQSGSVGGPNFGKQVASEIVTMVDFAHSMNGELCPVPVRIDDEGSIAKDAYLITDGILTSYMHNRESAEKFGHEALGNARAFSFSDEPLIRMRNTCILPGNDNLEDMISSIKDGYYFTHTSNGQADSTGEFMFGVAGGYEIKGGKLARPLRDSTISGIAFDVLKSVDMLSKEFEWSCSGYCGKKQIIPVGMGGPSLKCKITVGGR